MGMFNLEDEEQTLSFKASELGLDDAKTYALTDVWSGETYALKGSFSCPVVAHGAACWLSVKAIRRSCLMRISGFSEARKRDMP